MLPSRLWYGSDVAARVARGVLSPLSWAYASVALLRNRLFDSGVMRIHQSSIPVVSIGNVSVGGTGKTPLSAYLAGRLRDAGERPAIVMRGYGDDERLLHQQLNSGVPVYAGADRSAAILRAALAGATIAVLDDAFQHRRAGRNLDVVLVSAETWRSGLRVLPSGPLRERIGGVARADLLVVTRKSASYESALGVGRRLRDIAPEVPQIQVRFVLSGLVRAAAPGTQLALASLGGTRVLAVAGLGEPEGFFQQLGQAGAEVSARRFRDHHPYSVRDVDRLVRDAPTDGLVVTTGKDAVKLTGLWPANGPPLWYVSQAVEVTDGEPELAAALRDVVSR